MVNWDLTGNLLNPAYCLAAAWPLPGRCLAAAWPLPAKPQAPPPPPALQLDATHSTGSTSRASFFLFVRGTEVVS